MSCRQHKAHCTFPMLVQSAAQANQANKQICLLPNALLDDLKQQLFLYCIQVSIAHC